MREALPFEPPRLEEIATVTLSLERYEQLLDAETRLDIVMDMFKSDIEESNYISDKTKSILIATGNASYLKKLIESRGKMNG